MLWHQPGGSWKPQGHGKGEVTQNSVEMYRELSVGKRQRHASACGHHGGRNIWRELGALDLDEIVSGEEVLSEINVEDVARCRLVPGR